MDGAARSSDIKEVSLIGAEKAGCQAYATAAYGQFASPPNPNICVKYPSLLLYAHPDISVEHIRPVADFLVETFGSDRLLWGSNWPVELMGGSYEQAFSTMHAAIMPSTTETEREAIFGGNAAKFYRVY